MIIAVGHKYKYSRSEAVVYIKQVLISEILAASRIYNSLNSNVITLSNI